MIAPKTKPTVEIIGRDGNAFAILGSVTRALKKEGADKEYVDLFLKEATSGDYNHLLTMVMKYSKVK